MEWLDLGYWGLFLATFVSATVIPFSSEAVLAGIMVAGADPIVALAISSLGNTAGGMSSYGLGYLGDWKLISKYLRTEEDKVLRWKSLVQKNGAFASLLCWAPFVGDVIAIALGIFKVNPWKVLIWMAIGKTLRYVVVIWLLTNWQ